MIELSDFKNYMRISSTENDGVINDYIASAAELIENYCYAPILATTTDYTFKGLNGHFKALPFPKINALNSSYYRDKPSDSWTEIVCYLDEADGAYQVYNPLTFNKNHYKLNLHVGYTEVPSDVKLVCTEMVATIWNDSNLGGNNEGRLGLLSQNTNNLAGLSQTTTYQDLTKRWIKILNRYRVTAC